MHAPPSPRFYPIIASSVLRGSHSHSVEFTLRLLQLAPPRSASLSRRIEPLAAKPRPKRLGVSLLGTTEHPHPFVAIDIAMPTRTQGQVRAERAHGRVVLAGTIVHGGDVPSSLRSKPIAT